MAPDLSEVFFAITKTGVEVDGDEGKTRHCGKRLTTTREKELGNDVAFKVTASRTPFDRDLELQD